MSRHRVTDDAKSDPLLSLGRNDGRETVLVLLAAFLVRLSVLRVWDDVCAGLTHALAILVRHDEQRHFARLGPRLALGVQPEVRIERDTLSLRAILELLNDGGDLIGRVLTRAVLTLALRQGDGLDIDCGSLLGGLTGHCGSPFERIEVVLHNR